jgi:hypothetical protein
VKGLAPGYNPNIEGHLQLRHVDVCLPIYTMCSNCGGWTSINLRSIYPSQLTTTIDFTFPTDNRTDVSSNAINGQSLTHCPPDTVYRSTGRDHQGLDLAPSKFTNILIQYIRYQVIGPTATGKRHTSYHYVHRAKTLMRYFGDQNVETSDTNSSLVNLIYFIYIMFFILLYFIFIMYFV